jgi:farnesyl-diphosphate farnesyltransferase
MSDHIRQLEDALAILQSTLTREPHDYARKIHSKALPSDPNFLRISVACGKVRDLLTSRK